MAGTQILYNNKPALIIMVYDTHYFIEQDSRCFAVKKSEVNNKLEVLK